MIGVAREQPLAEPALRVLVVDDEPDARQRLLRMLRAVDGVEVAGECGTGRDALRAIEAQPVDLVFLDIRMPGIDGLAVARELAARGGPLVVFVSAYDAHAIEAFRIHAADYLLKPLDSARLREAVEHARAGVRRQRAERSAVPTDSPRLTLRDGHRTYLTPVREILWIESFGNYARVHATDHRVVHRATMATLAEQLEPLGFVRIHRGVIVNAARVRQLRPRGRGQCEAILDTGVRLPVGRTYRELLEQTLRASSRVVPGRV